MAKLYCEHCHNWQRLAQPGKEPIGWCPKQERRMGAKQFCRDHFDPIYPEHPIGPGRVYPDQDHSKEGGICHAQGPPH